jgi:hypothetical protein
MKIVFSVLFTLVVFVVQAQETTEVEAKGIGLTKNDALNDALRNAVGQAVGVALKSETRVENYMIIADAISTNIKGYVSSYQLISEAPFPDRYEVRVKAKISTSPMKADFQLLSKSIGGVRFLVMPDPKHYKDKNAADYDYAVQKINSYLAEKKYRYIEKSRFESLRKEAMNILQETDTGITYVQQLGVLADAQFLIVVSDINTSTVMGAFDIPRGTKVSLVAKAYDNCTGEGLGTIILESNSKPTIDQGAGFRSAIDEAVNNGFDKLLLTFTEYIGSWINNGTPFELRFYNTGTYRDFRDLRNALKQDSNFGGEMEVTSVHNYTKLNCTFRSKADDLADRLLDIADGIPNMAAKRLDVKMIYGRQISFAPQNYIIPNMVKPQSESVASEPAKPANTTSAKHNTTTPSSKPAGSSATNPSKTTTGPSTVKPANNNKTVTPANNTKPKQ